MAGKEMPPQSPTKSWDEQDEVLGDAKDGYGGRSSEFDLNKVATKVDEAEMDDYDSHLKDQHWPEGAGQDMGNNRQWGISPQPEQTEKSPSPKRSASPEAKPLLSPARRISVSPNRTQPDAYMEGRPASPRRSLSPSPRRGSPSVRQISLSPSKRYTPPVAAASRKGRYYRERSRSRSPVGRSDRAVSPYNRGYGGRYSRSPPPRDHRYSPRSRNSSRGRYSPRQRYSPPNYRFRRGRSPRRRPWSPPPNRSTGYGKPGSNLFIAGFSFVTTERDLERKFSRFGQVTDVRIVRDRRSGDSRGFGFLSLERDEEADAAIKALDQTEWNGRIVLVEKAKTPTHYDR